MEVFFYLSSGCQTYVMVKIHAVTGLPPINVLEQQAGLYYSTNTCSEEYELFVEVELYQKGMRLGLPVCCTYKLFQSYQKCVIDEWLRLPVRFCDIARDAQLVFTVYATSPVETSVLDENANESISLKPRPIGGVTLPLFESSILRFGRHKLRLKPDAKGNGSIDSDTLFWKLSPQLTVQDRLESIITRKAMRSVPKVDWLDGLTKRRIAKITGIGAKKTTTTAAPNNTPQTSMPSQFEDNSSGIYLWIDLPNFGHHVVYEEKATQSRPPKLRQRRAMISKNAGTDEQKTIKMSNDGVNDAMSMRSADSLNSGVNTPGAGMAGMSATSIDKDSTLNMSNNGNNTLYDKGRDRERDHNRDRDRDRDRERDRERERNTERDRNELYLLTVHDPEVLLVNPVAIKDKKLAKHFEDINIIPDPEQRANLERIINSPSRTLTEDEKQLLWKFRNQLTSNKKALTKFLRCVSQSSDYEVETAMNLVKKWDPIDVSSALELLGGYFEHPSIRSYGIEVLRKANDEELESFIMQLTQAIRFESSHKADLPQFLLDRSLISEDFRLLNFFYWSVRVQAQAEEESQASIYQELLKDIESQMKLRRPTFAVEIDRQNWLVAELIELSEVISRDKGRAEDKKQRLRGLIRDSEQFSCLKTFPHPVRMPVRPEYVVDGIIAEKCTVFKSAMCPFLLCFRRVRFDRERVNTLVRQISGKDITETGEQTQNNETKNDTEKTQVKNSTPGSGSTNNGNNGVNTNEEEDRNTILEGEANSEDTYRIIWKNGDDLRQDQLIIQMIKVMDDLLKRVNLDLYLTPYPVLATGLDHGMLEFVENSSAVAAILRENNDLSRYLCGQKNTRYVEQTVETFVRSCAGYCVITFLLGIGDRHLDNLLMTKDGRFFHIDFGFIYGEDPKPWPPPMKICKPMIDAMGGNNSTYYKQFTEHMCSSYILLRRSAHLILNLLSLMGQGDMETVEKNLNFVYQKFRLDLDDQPATKYMLDLVKKSVSALFPRAVDIVHDWATYWR